MKSYSDVEKIKESFEDLARSWDSAFVARTSLEKFSGGLLNPRTMSSLDCRGKGPFHIKVGRLVVYPKRDLINYLIQRSLSDWYRNKAYSDKGWTLCVAENASGAVEWHENQTIWPWTSDGFFAQNSNIKKITVTSQGGVPEKRHPLIRLLLFNRYWKFFFKSFNTQI